MKHGLSQSKIARDYVVTRYRITIENAPTAAGRVVELRIFDLVRACENPVVVRGQRVADGVI